MTDPKRIDDTAQKLVPYIYKQADAGSVKKVADLMNFIHKYREAEKNKQNTQPIKDEIHELVKGLTNGSFTLPKN